MQDVSPGSSNDSARSWLSTAAAARLVLIVSRGRFGLLALFVFAAWVGACAPGQRADRVASIRPVAGGTDSERKGDTADARDAAVPDNAPALDGSVQPPRDALPPAPPPDANPPRRPDGAVVMDTAKPPAVVAPRDAAMPVDTMQVETMPPGPTPPFAVVASEEPPALTDLSAPESKDWVHFGLANAANVNRKSGVATPLLVMTTFPGDFFSGYGDRPVGFKWTDGTPTMTVESTRDGINIGSRIQSGFQIVAEGDATRPRTVSVFVGAWNATARLTVSWTGMGAPAGTLFTDEPFMAGSPGKDRVYRIRFQPARGEHKLQVQWRLESVQAAYGNLTLQAAMLTE